MTADPAVDRIAEEASRLAQALLSRAASAGLGSAVRGMAPQREDVWAQATAEPHPPCRDCPLCRARAMLRTMSADDLARVVTAAGQLVAVAGEVVDDLRARLGAPAGRGEPADAADDAAADAHDPAAERP